MVILKGNRFRTLKNLWNIEEGLRAQLISHVPHPSIKLRGAAYTVLHYVNIIMHLTPLYSGWGFPDLLYVQHPPGQAHILFQVWGAVLLHSSLQAWWQGSHLEVSGPRYSRENHCCPFWWSKLWGLYQDCGWLSYETVMYSAEIL